jgi:anti-sigma factor ChrR (cupin superfamily)
MADHKTESRGASSTNDNDANVDARAGTSLNDADHQNTKTTAKPVDAVDDQVGFRFKNIDVKIQSGDVQVILSDDEADDILVPLYLTQALDTSVMLPQGLGTLMGASRRSRTLQPRRRLMVTKGTSSAGDVL